MAGKRAAGPILDELGVTFELDEQDRVTEVLLLAKVTDLDTGSVSLMYTHNDLDWISQLGLHAAAGQVLNAEPPYHPDDD